MPPDYPLLLTYVFFLVFLYNFPIFHHTGSNSLSKPNATSLFLQLPRHDFFYFCMKMGDCLGPQYLICLSVSQESQDPCAQPVCQHPIRGTLLWAVSLRGQLYWLVQGHTDSIRETPQRVFPHYSRMLPADSSCQCLWKAYTNNLHTLLMEYCDRLRFEDFQREYLTAKTNSKQYTGKLWSPVKALSTHGVWFLPNMRKKTGCQLIPVVMKKSSLTFPPFST